MNDKPHSSAKTTGSSTVSVLPSKPRTKRFPFSGADISVSILFAIWANVDASEVIPTQADRASQKEEEMARNKLSLADQLRGVKAALKSKRTPPQFREGLRKRKAELQERFRKGR